MLEHDEVIQRNSCHTKQGMLLFVGERTLVIVKGYRGRIWGLTTDSCLLNGFYFIESCFIHFSEYELELVIF